MKKKKITKKIEDAVAEPEIIEVGVSSPSDDGGVSVKKGLFILCFD